MLFVSGLILLLNLSHFCDHWNCIEIDVPWIWNLAVDPIYQGKKGLKNVNHIINRHPLIQKSCTRTGLKLHAYASDPNTSSITWSAHLGWDLFKPAPASTARMLPCPLLLGCSIREGENQNLYPRKTKQKSAHESGPKLDSQLWFLHLSRAPLLTFMGLNSLTDLEQK